MRSWPLTEEEFSLLSEKVENAQKELKNKQGLLNRYMSTNNTTALTSKKVTFCIAYTQTLLPMIIEKLCCKLFMVLLKLITFLKVISC